MPPAANDRHHRVAGVEVDFTKTRATATPVHGLVRRFAASLDRQTRRPLRIISYEDSPCTSMGREID